MDELEREVRAMLKNKAAGMPDEYNASEEFTTQVTRRRNAKRAGVAGGAAVLAIAVALVAVAGASGSKRTSVANTTVPSVMCSLANSGSEVATRGTADEPHSAPGLDRKAAASLAFYTSGDADSLHSVLGPRGSECVTKSPVAALNNVAVLSATDARTYEGSTDVAWNGDGVNVEVLYDGAQASCPPVSDVIPQCKDVFSHETEVAANAWETSTNGVPTGLRLTQPGSSRETTALVHCKLHDSSLCKPILDDYIRRNPPQPTTTTTLAPTTTTTPLAPSPVLVVSQGCALTSPLQGVSAGVQTVAPRSVPGITTANVGSFRSYAAHENPVNDRVTVLGPAGWSCNAYGFVSGGPELYVYPPSASRSFGTGQNAFSSADKYTGDMVKVEGDSFGVGSAGPVVCAVFAKDPVVMAFGNGVLSNSCALKPGRRVTKQSAAVWTFVDPDGTRGVGIMHMTQLYPIDGGFEIVSCKLGAQQGLCDTILNDYIARNPGSVPAGEDTVVNVAAVGCNTHRAITGQGDVAADSTRGTRPITSIPASQLSVLGSFESQPDDQHIVLGPVGWSCGYFVGGDGSGTFEVYPPTANAAKVAPYTQARPAGGYPTYNGPEVSIDEDFYPHGADIDLSCETFGNLPVVQQWYAQYYAGSSVRCKVAAGRQVTMQGKYAATFVDADGTHGAAAIGLNKPGSANGFMATLTCKTGPGLTQSMCDTIITEFLQRNRPAAEFISAKNRPGA